MAPNNTDMPRIIASYNQKGGAGKSVLAANLAAALADMGEHVLVLDMDRQGNVSLMLGVDPAGARANMTAIFEGRPLADCVIEVGERLDVVVGDLTLSDVELNLQTAKRREELLARQLDGELYDYDYVILDMPPSQGLIAINGAVLADEILAPIRYTDPNAVNGIIDLISFLDELADVGWRRPIRGLVKLDVDLREIIQRGLDDAVHEIAAEHDIEALDAIVKHTTTVSQSVAMGQPVVTRKPDSQPGRAFRAIAQHVANSAVTA